MIRFYRCYSICGEICKTVKCVFKRRTRKMVDIARMQFGFRPVKETTDAIFIVRQMQEICGNKEDVLILKQEAQLLLGWPTVLPQS